MGDTMIDSFLREQLLDRRQRLHSAIAETREIASLVQLLKEVDSALERMENGSYGICEFCHEPVEKERLIADPLVRYCLDHLTPDQQRALEHSGRDGHGQSCPVYRHALRVRGSLPRSQQVHIF